MRSSVGLRAVGYCWRSIQGSTSGRRACQWELTTAFLAAQRAGVDPRNRVLVVNPEQGVDHVQPVELRDARYAVAVSPGDGAGHRALAERVAKHVRGLETVLGDLGVSAGPSWWGQQPVGAARFVGRVRDMWKVHSALVAGDVGLITGACGDPAVKVVGLGGIGKSLLAREYALRFGAAYPGGVFWLRAHGHDDAGETLAGEAGSADRDTQLVDFARDSWVSTLLGLLRRRCRTCLHVSWTSGTRRSCGSSMTYRVALLMTPKGWVPGWRRPSWPHIAHHCSGAYGAIGIQIDLGVLTPEEGFELLARHRVPDGLDEEEQARGLVEDLGRHALALDVVGAALSAERAYALMANTALRWRTRTATSLSLRLGLRVSCRGEMRRALRSRSRAASVVFTIRALTSCVWRHSSPLMRSRPTW